MWSQYDENLSENLFFKEIQDNHNDIIEKVTSENWIICVPRYGTFEPTDITVDTILDHVLVPQGENCFCTLSKKYVTIKNKNIYINSSHLFGSNLEILFEETFYLEKCSKFTVWCVDRPLFLKYNCCNVYPSKVLENLHDCIDFLWAESLGHVILDKIRDVSNNFAIQNQELEAECLQTQKESIGKLYSDCLQIGLKNEMIREKSMKNNAFLENFKLAVETYMQYSLGRKLVFSVNTLKHQTDALLNRIIRNSCDIQLQDLGISNNFSDIIALCKCELNKINNYVTVLDKINCLKNTFNIMFDSNDNICTTSDDLLQILVFLILKLRISNWSANLTFMKEFRLSGIDSTDRKSFFITSLEAALEFIKSNQFLKIGQHSDTLLDSSQKTVNYIWDNIESGKIKSLNDIYSDLCSEKKLCHPLCLCTSCQNTVQSKEETHIDPRQCNDKGQNLLIVATIMGICEVVQFLLIQGFDVDFTDCFGRTSLHYAASKGFQNIVLLLINHNAKVNVLDNDKNTPLHLACSNGQESCIKAMLFSSGEVELNIGNFFGDTPLHLATKWGYFDIVKILLENGASVIVKNKRNQLALNLVPNYYVLKLFQRYGVQKSTTISKEFNDIYTAKVQEIVHVDDCKEHGVRPKNIEQFKKIDLLLKAIESNDLPLTCFHLGFLSGKARIPDKSTCHPLCTCEKCINDQDPDIDTPEKQQLPININMCNVNGYTPLHIAAKFGRTEILRMLLDSGALLNVHTYKTLYTPLHLACIFQRIQIVRELLKCGNCKIDEQDTKGNTPLYYACIKNDVKIVEILLSNGADCTKKNYVGRSPLQESEENLQYRVFKLMRNSMTNYLKGGSGFSSCTDLF